MTLCNAAIVKGNRWFHKNSVNGQDADQHDGADARLGRAQALERARCSQTKVFAMSEEGKTSASFFQITCRVSFGCAVYI
jgi:hypothetical protein